MRGRDRVGLARPAGRVLAPARVPSQAATHGSLCVIQWRDAVAEPAGDRLGVLDERLGGRARRPAAGVLERLRQVPVVERRERLDAVREQLVDEPVVEVEPGLVHACRARRGGRAATRSRSGTRRARARASARRRRDSGGRSRTRRAASPFRTLPGVAQNRSQMLSPRPSSWRRPRSGTRPSRRPRGSRRGTSCVAACLSSRSGGGAVTWQRAEWPAAPRRARRDAASRRRSRAGSARRSGSLRAVDGGASAPSNRSTCRCFGRDRDRGEQQPRVRVQRVEQHLLDRALLDDLAGVHDEDVVGDVARAREVVRDVEERDPALLLQPEHQVQDPDPDRDVEHRDRLVGEDHRVR